MNGQKGLDDVVVLFEVVGGKHGDLSINFAFNGDRTKRSHNTDIETPFYVQTAVLIGYFNVNK